MYHFNNFRSGLRGFSVALRKLHLSAINTLSKFITDFLTNAKGVVLSTGSQVSAAY